MELDNWTRCGLSVIYLLARSLRWILLRTIGPASSGGQGGPGEPITNHGHPSAAFSSDRNVVACGFGPHVRPADVGRTGSAVSEAKKGAENEKDEEDEKNERNERNEKDEKNTKIRRSEDQKQRVIRASKYERSRPFRP